jgi:carbonic anhydrase/acetyltransferase-like protein (isoleucine patch superfamily)
MVAAGAVVAAGTTVPSGELWAGSPAKRLRDLKPEEKYYLEELPARYKDLSAQHKAVVEMMHNNMDARVAAGAK